MSAFASSPRVTVLTATYNSGLYLDETIASILNQSYADFDYILIDDHSTDDTPARLTAWAARDPRIRLLFNDSTLQPGGCLNRGLTAAQGNYIAILDHDDLSMPTRLADQVAFLDEHPEIGVLGSQVQNIDADGKPGKIVEFPLQPILARWQAFFRGPAQHSAVMMRRALVTQVGGYKPSMWTATDYELRARLLQVTEIANLPTTLTAYRRSTTQISSRNHKMQSGQVILFLLAFVYERLGLRVALSDISAFYYGVRHEPLDSEEGVEAAATLLGKIYARFVAITPMSDVEQELVRQDCAWRYLVLAHSHRVVFRALSHQLFAQSLALDSQVLQRPKARTWLRANLKLP